jgi:hypothetical protein
MRSVAALVLLTVAAGAGAGVYYMPDMETDAAAGAVRVVVADATGRAQPQGGQQRTPVVTGDAAMRVYSAQTPLYGRADVAPVTGKAQAARGERLAEASVVGGEPIMRAGAPTNQDVRATSAPASREDLTRALAVDLHRELKRVGCYTGEMSGDWSAASKKAMKSFLDRVNAKLPVESPDRILLTLVKGHAAEACGKGCPAGQANDDDGKCMPRGLLVKAPAKDAPRTASASDVAPPSPGKTPDRVMLSSSWTTEVAPTTADLAAPMNRATIAATGSTSTAPSTTVLPGRMTLGATAVPATPPSTASMPYPPTLIQPPRALPNRFAAATQDTPNSAAGSQSAEPRARPQSRPAAERPEPATRPVPVQQARPEPVARPQLQPLPPQKQQRREVIVQRSYSGGVSTYVPPSYRPAPNRDWKQTVFTKSDH